MVWGVVPLLRMRSGQRPVNETQMNSGAACWLLVTIIMLVAAVDCSPSWAATDRLRGRSSMQHPRPPRRCETTSGSGVGTAWGPGELRMTSRKQDVHWCSCLACLSPWMRLETSTVVYSLDCSIGCSDSGAVSSAELATSLLAAVRMFPWRHG